MKSLQRMALIGIALLATRPATAQIVPTGGEGNREGITVWGMGTVKLQPSSAEIDGRVVAKGELADDAMVKFQQARQKALDALSGLKLKNLSVRQSGVSVMSGSSAAAAQAAMRGMPTNDADKGQIELSSTLHIQLNGIERSSPDEVLKTLGQILDAARDVGVQIGLSSAEAYRAYQYGRTAGGTLVKFVVRSPGEAREQAYEKAFADARTRAKRLARLSGVEIGAATLVQEVQVSGEASSPQSQYLAYVEASTASASGDEPMIATESFAGVPFHVKLLVRFRITSP